MNKRIMPSCYEVKKIIIDLTDDDEVNSRLLPAPWEPGSELFFVGTYCQQDGQPLALVRMEFPLAASLAASITRFMLSAVKEAIQNKSLTDELFMNLREIMNVFAGKLNNEIVPHVVFKDAYICSALPEPVSTLLSQTPSQRVDYFVEMPSYFDGKVSFLAFDQTV